MLPAKMQSFESVDELLSRAVSTYEKQFKSRPKCAACAPGRVNIIGEHTDYNDGFVFPMALPLVTVVVGNRTDDSVCRILTTAEGADEPKYVEFPAPSEQHPLTPGQPSWANYVKGVIACYPHQNVCPLSFNAVFVSSVPLGGGLSSSASLEVATFTLLEVLVGGSERCGEMVTAKCCQRAEHTFANMPCGIMDQFVATMGRADHALLIDCRSLEGRLVALKDQTAVFLVTNSNVRHVLSASEYPVRRLQCEAAAHALGVNKLRDATLTDLDAVTTTLDKTVYQRARHIITENQRCEDAAVALENADYVTFGRLMTASHNSLRDDYEVSCEELDVLVELAGQVEGVYGSRMTGGGFGGCTVTLVRADTVDKVVQHIKGHYSGRAQFYVCRAADGARELTVA